MLGIASGLMLANKVSEGAIISEETGNFLSIRAVAGSGVELVPFQSTIRGSFTFAFWAGVGAIAFSEGSTVFFGGQRTASSVTENLAFFIDDDAKLGYTFEANNDPVSAISASAALTKFSSNANHFAFVVTKNSSSNTTFAVYLNGSEVTMASATGALSETNHNQYTSAENLHLGAFAIADGAPARNSRNVIYKQAALWNSALNASNIAALQAMGHGLGSFAGQSEGLETYASGAIDLTSASGDYNAQGDLVAYWKLNEGSGTTANDSSGNGNNGTLVGHPHNAALV